MATNEQLMRQAQTNRLETIVNPPKSDNTEARNLILNLLTDINDTYEKLVNRGRAQDAEALRQTAIRFARSGSQMGVNAFARGRLLDDLKTKMRIAGQVAESKADAQRIDQTIRAIGMLRNVDDQTFSQAMQTARFRVEGGGGPITAAERAANQPQTATSLLSSGRTTFGSSDPLARADRLFKESMARLDRRAAAAPRLADITPDTRIIDVPNTGGLTAFANRMDKEKAQREARLKADSGAPTITGDKSLREAPTVAPKPVTLTGPSKAFTTKDLVGVTMPNSNSAAIAKLKKKAKKSNLSFSMFGPSTTLADQWNAFTGQGGI